MPVYSAAPPTVGFSGEERSPWSCWHRCVRRGHAFIDPEGYVVDEFAGTDSQREVLDVNHAQE